MTVLSLVSCSKCHGGEQKIFSHHSLTCTEKNFIEKSGFQAYAAKHGIIVVGPDTSPRNCNIEGEDERWDFGSGAGFYIDATEEKWKEHYRMYSYVTEELPALVNSEFPTNGKMSIFGHSMGGHGALICALKNPGKYKSVSAFSPICNPSECGWGKLCFTGYLGTDNSTWKDYDATRLVKSYVGPDVDILIDQGSEDQFLHQKELLPENLVAACEGTKVSVKLRMQEGYDHSYYFISSFIEDHFNHHAEHLA